MRIMGDAQVVLDIVRRVLSRRTFNRAGEGWVLDLVGCRA